MSRLSFSMFGVASHLLLCIGFGALGMNLLYSNCEIVLGCLCVFGAIVHLWSAWCFCGDVDQCTIEDFEAEQDARDFVRCISRRVLDPNSITPDQEVLLGLMEHDVYELFVVIRNQQIQIERLKKIACERRCCSAKRCENTKDSSACVR